MISWQKLRQRIDGSGPCEQDEVARGARHARLVDLDLRPLISRVRPSTSLIFGRVAWKSKNSSGSIGAKRVAPSEAPRNWSAAEAASPASFQPLNAQTSAGARRPSGRRSQISGCIRITVHHGFVPSQSSTPPTRRRGRDAAPRRRGRRRLRLHAQGPPDAAGRHAVPRGRAARPHGRRPGARRSATPTCTPGASSAATSCASPAASSASATSCRSTCARSPRAAATPTRRRSCPSPTATSTSSTASSSTSRGEVRDPAFAALLDDLLGDDELRAALRRSPCTRGGHHAYLGGLLEHTVAVATLAVETCALHPRLDQDLLLTAAIVHDLGRRASSRSAPRSGSATRAGCSATSSSACGCSTSARRDAGSTTPRRLALAHCVLTHHGPTRRRSGASARRGARAAPHQRARRGGQGGVRARHAAGPNAAAPALGAPAPRRWAAAPGGWADGRASVGRFERARRRTWRLESSFSTNGGEFSQTERTCGRHDESSRLPAARQAVGALRPAARLGPRRAPRRAPPRPRAAASRA